MTDSYKHKGLRKRMVAELKEKGIQDTRILSVMKEIPRHLFLDGAFAEWAYRDTAFPIDCDQTISQPYTVARQTELLEVEAGDRILEVGTGSGYQAAVLAKLGAEVFTIERIEYLLNKATRRFKSMGIKGVRTYYGDGYSGLPDHAPFDKIIVTAGASSTPMDLLAQLKVGGIMVVPIGEGEQTMFKITKKGENKYQRKSFGNYRFVPMLKGLRDT